MTEYPFFEIHPGYNPQEGKIGYVILIVSGKNTVNQMPGFYDNSFLAKKQIDQWEYERIETEKHVNQPPITYNPRMIH